MLVIVMVFYYYHCFFACFPSSSGGLFVFAFHFHASPLPLPLARSPISLCVAEKSQVAKNHRYHHWLVLSTNTSLVCVTNVHLFPFSLGFKLTPHSLSRLPPESVRK